MVISPPDPDPAAGRLRLLSGAMLLRIVIAAALTVLSLIGLPRLTVEGDMNSILVRPDLALDTQMAADIDAWQDPPVSVYLRWRRDDLTGFPQAVSNLILDIQFLPGVTQVVSVFSLASDPDLQALLLRAAEGREPAEDALAASRAGQVFGPTFVGPDLRSSILIVQGDADALEDVPALVDNCAPEAPLCVRAIGSVAIEAEIEAALEGGNRALPLISAALCFAIVALWYGNPMRAMALMVPPGLGLIWYFGIIAWLGYPVDVFNTIVPSVVLSLGLADMLHLQRARALASSAAEALRHILPAITLTTVTTALGFATIWLEGSEALRRLAVLGALGVSLLWLSVVLVGPVAVQPKAVATRRARRLVSAVVLLATRLGQYRKSLQGAAALTLALGGLAFAITPVDFRFDENLPSSDVSQALTDAAGDGLAAAPIFAIGDSQPEAQLAETASRLYGQTIAPSALPPEARQGADAFALPYLTTLADSGADILETAQTVKDRIGAEDAITVTGYPITVADTLLTAIKRLEMVLLVCFALQAVLLGAMLGSAKLGLAALVPNLLPIFAISVAMRLGPEVITFASAICMIVASGIVVDDTAHLMLASRRGPAQFSIARGIRRVAEPVTLTTLVLIAGVASLLASGLPGVQQFAGLFMLAVAIAWIADMILLSVIVPRPDKGSS